VNELVAVVVAYLLGSIPFAYLAGRARGVDLRTVGSGNLGAANVFRALGRRMGIGVMAADILKGVVAVVIARLITDDPWPAIAAAAAMAGHVYPVWLRFKGGKGVAVGGGTVIALAPLAALGVFAIWILVVATTRYTSLASIIGALAATPLVWAFGYPVSSIVFVGLGSAALLVLHRDNIRRLLAGRENRIEFRRARPGLSDAPRPSRDPPTGRSGVPPPG
jgi:glycerol-3-phosphate acyltransferase PlsY